MGAVYAAHDARLDREVAVKVSVAPAPGSELDERLRRESRILARLEHPGIVPVHDAGALSDGRLFYVMKLVRGETLASHARPHQNEPATLAIFERIVDAVAFAHAAGVIHRDLKPSNVMIGPYGDVLVVDWGAARVLGPVAASPAAGSAETPSSRSTTDRTSPGTRVGTPGFMSPEQARGSADVGPASDVYSLGALLFWLLSGEAPEGPREEAARRFAELAPRPPRRLRAITLKCLSARPPDRYRDAAALAEDLARYRTGAAVEAHRETPTDRLRRFATNYRGAILLVLAYLVMRTVFAFLVR